MSYSGNTSSDIHSIELYSVTAYKNSLSDNNNQNHVVEGLRGKTINWQ